jgi:hypothetical protein
MSDDDQSREARELEESGVGTHRLVCRLVPRVEYAIRRQEATDDRLASLVEANLQLSEAIGRLAGDVGRLIDVVGEPPDPARKRLGSGLYGLVATLWSERRGAAVGAIVGGSGAVGLIEVAKMILEALR